MVQQKPDTIFVSIASYRDEVCNSTLHSLFDMAQDPTRVFAGICQQNKDGEDSECNKAFENNPNVRIIRIPYYEAKGPTYARYLCSTLWDGEEYFMQIDSHSKFVKNWDTLCIQMIDDIKKQGLSAKPVLSHYPKEIEAYDKNDDTNKTHVPRICKSFFNSRGMLSFLGAQEMDSKGVPYQTPYVSGGMLFAESRFLQELPYDPNLPFLFVGEEILHSVRFYTHGWDVYTPTQNIVFHEYTRANKPKIWTDNPVYSDSDAFEKVKEYLHLVDGDGADQRNLPSDVKFNMNKYGLGSERTLQDYYKFAGIDVAAKKVSTNFCAPGNAASPEDILRSNEQNWAAADAAKKEGFVGGVAADTSFEELFPRLAGPAFGKYVPPNRWWSWSRIAVFLFALLVLLAALFGLWGVGLFRGWTKSAVAAKRVRPST